MSGAGGASSASAAKAALRRRMAAALDYIGPAERAAAGERAATALKSNAAYGPAALVLAFLSMPAELDTGPALRMAIADGKRVAVPRIEGADIEFVELSPGWEDWPRDRWDIPAPPAGAAALDAREMAAGPTVALIPGLAFDEAGRRLGRGKGYYDRFLARIEGTSGGAPRRFTALGLCYRAQLVGEVPADSHDRPVDGLILV